jgi:sphingosine kinase
MELINGLASRPDALSALRMPIAPIPAGSGNALSVNIMGPEKVIDVAYAALNAIKGVQLRLPGMWSLLTVFQASRYP